MDQNNRNNPDDRINENENQPPEEEIEEDSSNDLNNTTYPDDSDEEYADYSYRTESPLELIDKKDIQNIDRIPLIPTDFTSITEAMQNFAAVFESRYGAQHAPFYQGPLQEAITDAFDNPIIEDRRPLAIYLHHDDAVASHIFPQTVLCTMEVSNLMKCQFLVWGWDMSQQQNRQTFYEWLSINNLGHIADSIRMIATSKYPLLVILVKEKGQVQRSTLIYGQENTASTIQKLMLGLDHFQQLKEQEKQEEHSRMEREQFRREQAEEYERSLAADRAKQQELNEHRKREIEDEEKKNKQEQEKKSRLNALASVLPSEPPVTDQNAVTIRFRSPNGELKERRFRRDESIEMLVIYTETIGFDRVQYRLWTSDRPRKEVGNMDTSKTFAQLSWPKREQITIEELC